KDLRPYGQACQWAAGLDLRNNPYDRFLLRREILHHIESEAFYEARLYVFSFASRSEIAAEVDRLIDSFDERSKGLDVFTHVLLLLPWELAFKHGRIRYKRLATALGE